MGSREMKNGIPAAEGLIALPHHSHHDFRVLDGVVPSRRSLYRDAHVGFIQNTDVWLK